MLKQALSGVVLALAALVASGGPAAAHQGKIKIWKPYVIEKYCAEDNYTYCRARMDYAPFQHSMLAGPGSYWYQWPPHGHRHHHHKRPAAKHVQWCMARYRTYDPQSDTFVGKGYKRTRCNSPHDGM